MIAKILLACALASTAFDAGADAAFKKSGGSGPNGAFGARQGAAADGNGNFAAGAEGAFTTESGAQGKRRAKVKRNSDGSANASRDGSFEGNNASAQGSGSYTRDANGNVSGSSSITATNKNTGETFEKSTTYGSAP